jgi:pilus assembly protein CpaF
MKLAERLNQGNGNGQPAHSLIPAAPRRARDVLADSFQQLKLEVHNRLFETLEVSRLESLDTVLATAKVTQAINDILNEQGRLITDLDRERLISEVRNELLGLGPLEPLLWDDEISDILVNGPNNVYIERHGKLYKTKVTFQDDQHLMLIIDRIVSQVGRRVDEGSPMVDARLPDGSRVNAIIAPLALDGPSLSIRRFGHHRFTIDDLVEKGTLTPQMVELLRAMVRARLNILIAGGTGSGKTTLLNCMSAFIPEDERIVTIEDSAELSLSSSRTWCGWKPARPTSRARARSTSAIWCATRCACAPTGSSSARSAVQRCSTCCRRCQPATTVRSPRCTPTTRATASGGSK